MRTTPHTVPRGEAIQILGRVLGDRKPLDEALEEAFAKFRRGDERAWLRDVCSGTLRWKSRLDQAIDSVALKKRPTGRVRRVLLVAAYQLVAQRTPAAIVVDESVQWVKQKEGEPSAKFVNALLRKVAAQAAEYRDLPKPAARDPRAHKLLYSALPEWFYDRLARDFGEESALAFGARMLERPAIFLRAREDAPPFPGCEPTGVARAFRVKEREGLGSVDQWPGFTDGSWLVQDLSSQRLLAEVDALYAREGWSKEGMLDLCAAPGGKSVGLRWLGFEVAATDRSENRLSLLHSTLQRCAPDVKVVPYGDALAAKPWNSIWVDAPCTSSGILARHPDIRWTRDEGSIVEDLRKATAAQTELCRAAWDALAPGGILVYSVCSVFKAEGEGLVASLPFADRLVASYRMPASTDGAGAGAGAAPVEGDGFFGAVFRKS